MIRYFLFSLLVCVLISISTAVLGQQPAQPQAQEFPEEVAKRLQNRYDGMRSLSFTFHQDTRGELSGKPRKGTGKAIFSKKSEQHKMRWDYSAPDTQVLVSDGVHFSMYFEKLQQMIITSAENLDKDLTYSFFTGKGNLQTDFHIRPADAELQSGSESTLQVIKLIPKSPQSQVQDIHIWVTKDSLARRIHLKDHFGTITVLNFSEIQPNALKTKSEKEIVSLFSFSPPDGTEIIEQ
jgi:outer membrane lipoprotein carrier protein